MGNFKREALVATVKGVAGAVPFVGPITAEYIGLWNHNVASKRQEEWMKLLEERLAQLESFKANIAEDEFFYSCVQMTTIGALKAHEKEKRRIFADALYNSCIKVEFSEEKREIFITLIDRYTLLDIKLLKHFSKDRFQTKGNDTKQNSNMLRTHTSPSQESPIKAIGESIPELLNEQELAKVISTKLYSDGLILAVDFEMPAYPERTRCKKTTSMGDQFIDFITADKFAG